MVVGGVGWLKEVVDYYLFSLNATTLFVLITMLSLVKVCSTVIARYDYKVCISPGLNKLRPLSYTESVNAMYTLISAGMLRD